MSEVSVRGYDGGGDIDTMVLTVYGSDDTVIGSASMSDVFFPGNELAWVGGDIAYATFHVEGTISGLFYDDLRYTVVPEPATAMILLIGALALAARCLTTRVRLRR